MATKKRTFRKKKTKTAPARLIALLFFALLLGGLYYLWTNHGDAVSEITGLDLPPAPTSGKTVTQTQKPPSSSRSASTPSASTDRLKIYSFNIQIFGDSKMRKTKVVDVLVDIVKQADLTAVQEVRAKTDQPVRDFMALLPQKYDYVLGPREGRSASKEQFWVIYDREKLEVMGSATFNDAEDRFQRSPLGVYFQAKNGSFDFIIINNHIEPSGAAKEIEALPEVITYFQKMWKETDALVVGDFNADGGYYNENNLASVFPEPNYKIILTNEYDTTVAVSDNTYDRFIITKSAIEDFTGDFGVIYFDKLYDFAELGIEPKHVSDHYPIWAEFYLDRDTD